MVLMPFKGQMTYNYLFTFNGRLYQRDQGGKKGHQQEKDQWQDSQIQESSKRVRSMVLIRTSRFCTEELR